MQALSASIKELQKSLAAKLQDKGGVCDKDEDEENKAVLILTCKLVFFLMWKINYLISSGFFKLLIFSRFLFDTYFLFTFFACNLNN